MTLKPVGFEINKSTYDPHPVLTLSELHTAQSHPRRHYLTTKPQSDDVAEEAGKIVFDFLSDMENIGSAVIILGL